MYGRPSSLLSYRVQSAWSKVVADKKRTKYGPAVSMDLPRFAGIATFMGLPQVTLDEAGDVDIGLIGVPWDGGTTNRPGPRHGPRQMRDMS